MTTETYQTREEWLERRHDGIGASDAPSILGLSPWRGPLETYCEKLRIAQVEPTEIERLEWGLALQPLIGSKYARETGRTLTDPGPYTIHQSEEYPWMFASLDGIVDAPDKGRGVLEVKNVGWRSDDWDGDGPLMYQVQVQHQLAVTGLAWGSLAVLVGGSRFYWLDVQRDDAFIAALIKQESAFWDRVQRHDPPPPDASESCRELLKRIYPREAPGKTVALPGDAARWDDQRRDAKAAMDVAEASCREAENLLISALGDAEVGILPDGSRYSYKQQQRKGYTVEANSFRVLRRSAAK